MSSDFICAGAVRMLLSAAIGCQAALYARPSVAELVPQRGAIDTRVRTAEYDADQVYRLRGRVGYQIDVVFEGGETFVGLGAGDIDGLSYFSQDNHLFLKPKAARIATNLTVLTSRRHYQFDYSAATERPTAHDPDVMYVVRFVYGGTSGKAATDMTAKHIETDLAQASAQRRQNLDYWYCGVPSLRPISVSDDGIHTRLRFAANGDLPAIFVRNDDDSESLLNYSMDDGDVIVHRIARKFVLRRGKLSGCVVNKGFTGGGIRLDSGTVTPDVQRQLQESAP